MQAKAALPELRKSRGRIIFTSSGAATGAYSAWGAYGGSKAAMNHLAMTLAVEEPQVISVSIRPGTVDTEMQRELREVHHTAMDKKDAEKFAGLKSSGSLLRPDQPGHVIAKLALDASPELSGKFITSAKLFSKLLDRADSLSGGMTRAWRPFNNHIDQHHRLCLVELQVSLSIYPLNRAFDTSADVQKVDHTTMRR